jgi:hypothetical protein
MPIKPVLTIYIRGEGTSTNNLEQREGFLDVLHAIKRSGHKVSDSILGADLIIDHLALGAPLIEEGEERGMLDWATARVILESMDIIQKVERQTLKHKEQ